MARWGVLATLLMLVASPALAQETDPDKIFFTSGDSVEGVVTEVLPDAVKYRKWSNRTGPVYTVPKADLHMILYANGEHELMRPAEGTGAPTETSAPEARAAAPAKRSAAPAPTPTAPSAAPSVAPGPSGQLLRGKSSHYDIGLKSLPTDDVIVFLDMTENNFLSLASSEDYYVGIGGVLRSTYLSSDTDDYFVGTLLVGPNLMADYYLGNSFSVFGSVGAGPVWLATRVGEESANDFDFDFVASTGAAFWFADWIGVNAKLLLGDGGSQFTMGISYK